MSAFESNRHGDVSQVEPVREKTLSGEQQYAVELCADLTQRIVSVTGGAGSGKTYVMGKAYAELMKTHRNQIALCAPTGRAAKRIYELTGIKARTVHKLLEFPVPGDDPVVVDNDKDDEDQKEENPHEPRRNAYNPFAERIIIVDEASMVGPELYRFLMEALPKNGCIRFFGDNNQLLPVEKGEPPFRTLLSKYPAVTLSYNYRSQDKIVSNAIRILGGSIPLRNDQFEILYSDAPINALINYVAARPEFATGDHQIIMPTRKGGVGTAKINPYIQVKLNKSKKLLRLPRFDENEADLPVRANDKFLWVKNDYQLNLFNGEIGKIKAIDEEDGTLDLITSEGRQVEIPARVRMYNTYLRTVINYDPRKQLELGYAITTHKAQGSEFDTVVYCMSSASAFLLNRNNFYTAVTRARHKVVVICDRRGMAMSLRREKRDQ